MKQYVIWLLKPELRTPMTHPTKVTAESSQDALELFRLQHPSLWTGMDLKNRTYCGEPIYIEEGNIPL